MEAVKQKLQCLIQDTESYYGVIYASLPPIERNIELTLQETDMVVQYFIETAADASEDRPHLMAYTLDTIESGFASIQDILFDHDDVNALLGTFLNTADHGVSFDSFLQLVIHMYDSLRDVCDWALNAMAFSAAACEGAAGFGVLSQNVHELSLALAEQTRIV